MPQTLEQPPHGLAVRVARGIVSVLVVGAVAGFAYWGHATHWHFHDPADSARNSESPAGLTRLRVEPARQAGGERILWLDLAEEASPEKMGLDVAAVWRAPRNEEIPVSGELSFQPQHVTRLASRLSGTVQRLVRKPGDPVSPGTILALIDAPEVGKAKADLLQALVLERRRKTILTGLAAGGSVIPERQRREAETALQDAEVRRLGAEQTLANLGLPVPLSELAPLDPDSLARRLHHLGLEATAPETTPGSPSLLPIRASREGVVLSVETSVGAFVEAGKPLMVVVDPRKLWLTLHLPAEQVSRVAVGMPVRFLADGSTDALTAPIRWIGTAAEEGTRLVPARVEVANEDGRLKAATLAKGQVIVRSDPNALVVPREAVQNQAGQAIVFVRHPGFLKGGPRAFEARFVQLGSQDDALQEIRAGLAQDEVVVTRGSALLAAELNNALRPGATEPERSPRRR